jgi:hypothetical protein
VSTSRVSVRQHRRRDPSPRRLLSPVQLVTAGRARRRSASNARTRSTSKPRCMAAIGRERRRRSRLFSATTTSSPVAAEQERSGNAASDYRDRTSSSGDATCAARWAAATRWRVGRLKKIRHQSETLHQVAVDS